MRVLLHTIALEPERWTPKKVSRPLKDLLGPIAAAGFRELEIFEPHLGPDSTSQEIKKALRAAGLKPVVLSSYLNLNPAMTTDAEVKRAVAQFVERVRFYGFSKIRLFAGGKLKSEDKAGVDKFIERVALLADRLPGTEILLETHDGSLADDPAAIVDAVRRIGRPNVGLLFQPTYFDDPARTLEQYKLQKPYIRHLHLQNRNPDVSFATMAEGIVPWPEIFALGAAATEATLEFVPSAIGKPEEFDLAASIEEAKRETDYVKHLAAKAARALPVEDVAPPQEKRAAVTLRDIAKALGLSHVTVSLALRDNPRIPEKRRQQVQKTAAAMGYRPNPMGAGLAHFRTSSRIHPVRAALAWLNFWEPPEELRKHAEFEGYFRGASACAEKFGYNLDSFECNGKHMTLGRLEEVLVSRGIHGVLLPPQRTSVPIADFAWSKFSAVRFGRSVTQPRLHVVTADHVHNAMMAYEKIRELGYRRIGYIGGPAYRLGALHAAGFAMAQQFVPAAERLPVFLAEKDEGKSFREQVGRWLKQVKPDAILSDIPETREVLEGLGFSVPGDVALATTSVLDGRCDTGIDQHPEEIGRVAMLFLISLLNDRDCGEPKICRQALVQGSWVQGLSMPPTR